MGCRERGSERETEASCKKTPEDKGVPTDRTGDFGSDEQRERLIPTCYPEETIRARSSGIVPRPSFCPTSGLSLTQLVVCASDRGASPRLMIFSSARRIAAHGDAGARPTSGREFGGRGREGIASRMIFGGNSQCAIFVQFRYLELTIVTSRGQSFAIVFVELVALTLFRPISSSLCVPLPQFH